MLGQEMSGAAIAMMAKDLSGIPEAGVMQALSRCRKELRKITLADILNRVPGGHPGAEEAWSIVAKALTDERVTVVWTQEISEAFGRALDLNSDPVAARMAFKEVYTGLVARSRDEGRPVKWIPSLGQDPLGREAALFEAERLGRLTRAHVVGLLPYRENPHQSIQALIEKK